MSNAQVPAGNTPGMANELVDIDWTACGPMNYNETHSKSYDLGEVPGYYRIPILTADVLRFYFGSNWYKMLVICRLPKCLNSR